MELLDSLSLHRLNVTCVRISGDGKLVASGSLSGTIAVTPVGAFGANGTAGNETITQHGVMVKQPRSGLRRGGVPSLAFQPGRPVLITVGGQKDAVFWDTASLAGLRPAGDLSRLRAGIWGPWGSAVSPSGTVLAIGAAGPAITLIDLSDPGQPLLPPGASPHPRPSLSAPRARELAFHPSGGWLAAGNGDGSLAIWAVSTAGVPVARRATGVPAHAGVVLSVSFSPDGGLLATTGWDDKTIIWDTSDPSSPVMLAKISARNKPVAAFGPHAPVLAIADGVAGDGTIALWDMTSPESPAHQGTAATDRVSALGWSADGRALAAGYLSGSVALWRV